MTKHANHFLLIPGIFLLVTYSCHQTKNAIEEEFSLEDQLTLTNDLFKDAGFTLWVKEDDEENSLLIVTGSKENTGIHAYDLAGKLIHEVAMVGTVQSPSIGYGIEFTDGTEADVLLFIHQESNRIRFLRLPDFVEYDRDGIDFEAASDDKLNRIVAYTRDQDDAIFVIANNKNGPSNNHWSQYRLSEAENQSWVATKIRSFGVHDGAVDIDVAVVDAAHEYFYYVDPGVGIRKYFANPTLGSEELCLLQAGNNEFRSLSSYELHGPGGYIAAAGIDKLYFFSRGEKRSPHRQPLVHSINLPVDDLVVTSSALNDDSFSKGLLITKKVDQVQWYDWRSIAQGQLIIAPNGIPDYSDAAIKPKFVTDPTISDTDDPAIWIHPSDPSKSLVIGTDKEEGGGIYVYNLEGKILQDKVVTGLHRPNNVDLAYGLMLAGNPTDFIMTTERNNEDIRAFSFPDMKPIDNGGIPVFEGESDRDPMGISLYKRPTDGAIFAIVGRKSGPRDNYLWQYRVEDDGNGAIKLTMERSFGKYSGKKEIEAIAVDATLGYIYYSDEGVGIRKYYADPDKGNEELALFGQWDFGQDHEGISIFELNKRKGYILVSDQQRNRFNIYPREGADGDPHQHELITSVELSTMESDGSEVTSQPLGPLFPNGLFVAMSSDKTFHFYDWKDIAYRINK